MHFLMNTLNTTSGSNLILKLYIISNSVLRCQFRNEKLLARFSVAEQNCPNLFSKQSPPKHHIDTVYTPYTVDSQIWKPCPNVFSLIVEINCNIYHLSGIELHLWKQRKTARRFGNPIWCLDRHSLQNNLAAVISASQKCGNNKRRFRNCTLQFECKNPYLASLVSSFKFLAYCNSSILISNLKTF